MFMTLLAKHGRMALNMNLFSSAAGEGRSKPAICYNTWLKRLRVCANAVGVDHRITVSMAVNQGIIAFIWDAQNQLLFHL